jgi:copper resistance protein B
MVTYSGFAVSAEKQTYTDDASADADSEWEFKIRLNKFERQLSTDSDETYGEWAGFIRLGKEFNKFWLTTKGSTQVGEVDSSEIRVFYSRTIKPSIAVTAGWRRDVKPDPERDWLTIGLLGVLPYKIGADVSLFIGESGRQALRLEVAYKYWFTPKLSLTPDLEANFYSKMIRKEASVPACPISILVCDCVITSSKACCPTRV